MSRNDAPQIVDIEQNSAQSVAVKAPGLVLSAVVKSRLPTPMHELGGEPCLLQQRRYLLLFRFVQPLERSGHRVVLDDPHQLQRALEPGEARTSAATGPDSRHPRGVEHLIMAALGGLPIAALAGLPGGGQAARNQIVDPGMMP